MFLAKASATKFTWASHGTCVQSYGCTVMESVKSDTYLGDVISFDGSNTQNIKKVFQKEME